MKQIQAILEKELTELLVNRETCVLTTHFSEDGGNIKIVAERIAGPSAWKVTRTITPPGHRPAGGIRGRGPRVNVSRHFQAELPQMFVGHNVVAEFMMDIYGMSEKSIRGEHFALVVVYPNDWIRCTPDGGAQTNYAQWAPKGLSGGAIELKLEFPTTARLHMIPVSDKGKALFNHGILNNRDRRSKFWTSLVRHNKVWNVAIRFQAADVIAAKTQIDETVAQLAQFNKDWTDELINDDESA